MRLHLHAAATALLTFVLMALGSLVHGTGSSLACPDWPLCHGEVFPAMRDGVEFEHTHRLVALAVVVCSVTLALRARAERRGRRLAFAAVLLVVVQATLGAATVLLRLPAIVSIAHLGTSMALLAIFVSLAVATWPRRSPSLGAARLRPLLLAAMTMAIVQAVLGAVVRHAGAALACTELPWCASAWPTQRLEQLHVLHRGGAVVVAFAVVAACVKLARRAPELAGPAFAPVAIVVVQGTLGAAVIVSGASLPVVTLHHATGALLVASLAALAAVARPAAVPSGAYATSCASRARSRIQIPS